VLADDTAIVLGATKGKWVGRSVADAPRRFPPSAFIPTAERYNQMPAIDRWVIRSVFAALHRPDTIMPSGSVAINLSGQSLSDRQFLEYVEQQIEACAVVLERICFEITETAAISNLSLAKRFFTALKAARVPLRPRRFW
jgi:EAL domain-containing protein (putative c-di-GMP-specific phosphodiesterase class I)